jgi:hypothetical protein
VAFTTISRRAEVIQWDGVNDDEIRDFIGPDNFNKHDGQAQIRTNGESDIWRNLHPGFRIVRDIKTGFSVVFSPGSFEYLWQQE